LGAEEIAPGVAVVFDAAGEELFVVAGGEDFVVAVGDEAFDYEFAADGAPEEAGLSGLWGGLGLG